MVDDFVAFTAVALAVGGVLLLISSLLSRVGSRFGVPVNLLFLIIGMLAGEDGPGGIDFNAFDVSYAVGTTALVIILFSGGLNTRLDALRRVLAPASVLAGVGVIGIAALTALGARVFGLSWPEALLFGAIVSSTDAAAVIALLDGVPLRRRVAHTLEAESGLNDPVAVILTTAATANLGGWGTIGMHLLPDILVQLVVGVIVGLGVGVGGAGLMRRVRLSTPALFPAVALAVAFIAFGVATYFDGSGFLAVYLAGISIGNAAIPYRLNLTRFHDSLAWLAQIAMFLLLGLLVNPSGLPPVAFTGFVLALYLAVVARPIVVTLCLLPFGYAPREIACIAWLGLRGAVPIILATVPVLWSDNPGAPPAELLNEFDLVFFVVVVGSFIPGMTVRHLPRLLGLEEPVTPEPSAVVDIVSSVPMRETQLSVFIAHDSPAAGVSVQALALPENAAVMLIVRDDELIAPRGHIVLQVGDHVFLITDPDSSEMVRARFLPGGENQGGEH
jgi:cell volume regulation protein A